VLRHISTASQCLAWASLVGVQLQLGPEVRLVGLTQAEARKTMGLRPFREGITLARAYDLHRLKYVVVIVRVLCVPCVVPCVLTSTLCRAVRA